MPPTRVVAAGSIPAIPGLPRRNDFPRVQPDVVVVSGKIFKNVTRHIWEIKAHYGDEQFRLYAFKDEALVIAAVGVQKKWQKVRQSDLDLVEQRRREYFLRTKPALQREPP